VLGKSDDNNNRKRRVVIVTGSGKGIGKAIAIEFAKAVYYVMINDFEKEEEKQDNGRRVVITTKRYNNTLLIEKVLKYKHSNYWISISS
jgi:NAD(P)-dependent dehydrogenase (short-subunit alcohol dehydrogenase family)